MSAVRRVKQPLGTYLGCTKVADSDFCTGVTKRALKGTLVGHGGGAC